MQLTGHIDRNRLTVHADGVLVFAAMGLPEDGSHGPYADWADWEGNPQPPEFQLAAEALVQTLEA